MPVTVECNKLCRVISAISYAKSTLIDVNEIAEENHEEIGFISSDSCHWKLNVPRHRAITKTINFKSNECLSESIKHVSLSYH